MKKALIIVLLVCQSSMMAAKTTDWFKTNNKDYEMDAVSVTEGQKMIETSDFDLFLISPQTKMYLKKFQATGDKVGKKVVPIPPQAYVPIPSGVKNLAEFVLKEMPE